MKLVTALGLVVASALRSAVAADSPVIVFVPGYMSSELRIGGQVLWYPQQSDQLSANFTRLAIAGGPAMPSDGAVATSVLAPSDALPKALARQHDVLAFPYDWRKGTVDAARQLERFLTDHPLTSSGRPVTLVAHSMGGLVAMALAARNGLVHLDRIVTIGTPHLGAPSIVMDGFRGMILGPGAALDAIAMQRSQPTWPSFYDMLPAYPIDGGIDCCMIAAGADILQIDLLSPSGFSRIVWPSAPSMSANLGRQLAESAATRTASAWARSDRLFAVAGLSALPGQDEARTTPLAFTLSSNGSMEVGHEDACDKANITCAGGDLVVPQYSATYGQVQSGIGLQRGTCTVRLGTHSHGDMLTAAIVHAASNAAISATDNRAAWCPPS